MAKTRFALNQSSDGSRQSAELSIPGCGHSKYPDGPIAHIEIQDGKPVLYVWADINSEDWTHKIDLENALESSREAE